MLSAAGRTLAQQLQTWKMVCWDRAEDPLDPERYRRAVHNAIVWIEEAARVAERLERGAAQGIATSGFVQVNQQEVSDGTTESGRGAGDDSIREGRGDSRGESRRQDDQDLG